MSDEPYNAAERSHVKAAVKATRVAERERAGIIRTLMDTTAGRAYMHAVLERCHVFASSFNTDSLNMAFAEGERNIGLQFLRDVMQACPDMYVLMMREANERSASQSNARRPDREPDAFGPDREPDTPERVPEE